MTRHSVARHFTRPLHIYRVLCVGRFGPGTYGSPLYGGDSVVYLAKVPGSSKSAGTNGTTTDKGQGKGKRRGKNKGDMYSLCVRLCAPFGVRWG